MSRPKAIITGITGQDGAYLQLFCLRKIITLSEHTDAQVRQIFGGYKNLGIMNHSHLTLAEHDLTDLGVGICLIQQHEPEEIYNLAAQSYVGVSFQQPVTTTQISALGVLNLLEAIRTVNPKIRFFQASTSEMFGKAKTIPQNEDTPFHPRSPYGVAKLYAHWITINYCESYNIFACSGILFNHESPLRGKEFVTRKIQMA